MPDCVIVSCLRTWFVRGFPVQFLSKPAPIRLYVSWIFASADSVVNCSSTSIHTLPMLQDGHHHTVLIKSNENAKEILNRTETYSVIYFIQFLKMSIFVMPVPV